VHVDTLYGDVNVCRINVDAKKKLTIENYIKKKEIYKGRNGSVFYSVVSDVMNSFAIIQERLLFRNL